MHFKEKFEWFLKNRMKEENADKASLSWKNRRSQRGTGWDFPTCCMRFFYKLHACVQSLSCVQLSTAPWTVAHQAPLSMEFFRQEYWSGLPFPSPRDLPNPGIEPSFPTLVGCFCTTEPPGKPCFLSYFHLNGFLSNRNHLAGPLMMIVSGSTVSLLKLTWSVVETVKNLRKRGMRTSGPSQA